MARVPVSASRFLPQTFFGLFLALLALLSTIQQCCQIHSGRLKSKFHLLKHMVSHMHNFVGATTCQLALVLNFFFTKNILNIRLSALNTMWFSWYILVPSMFGDSLQAWWVAAHHSVKGDVGGDASLSCSCRNTEPAHFSQFGDGGFDVLLFFHWNLKVCDSKGRRF